MNTKYGISHALFRTKKDTKYFSKFRNFHKKKIQQDPTIPVHQEVDI